MVYWKEKIKKALNENKPLPKSLKALEVINFKYTNKIIHKKSAVLILVFPDTDNNLNTIIIKRAKDNSPHSGQIALPGGRKDLKDINLKRTALREVKEELGIEKDIEILGRLKKIYIPVSNFLVQPFVGWIDYEPHININKDEIKEYYIIPIIQLIKASERLTNKKIYVRGQYLEVKGISYNGIFIWGATAKILADFINRIKGIF